MPFGIEFFVEVELSNVVVSIYMNAEVHPFVINARKVAGAVATSVDSAVARSLGAVLTIVGFVEIDLHSPSAVCASKVVQYVEVTILALWDENVKFEVIDTC